MSVDTVGAFCFGLIIGWVTYRTLRRTGETVAVSNIAAVGGAAVTGLFKGQLFGWYCIGLTVGFFGYLALAATLLKNVTWLGDGS
jgi:hypothetical protein